MRRGRIENLVITGIIKRPKKVNISVKRDDMNEQNRQRHVTRHEEQELWRDISPKC